MILYLINKNKEECCGCTACKSICPTKAIEMKPDEEGFLYPQIDQNLCIDCGVCRKVCAFQNGYDVPRNYDSPFVYAAKHIDEKVRMSSSSGGAFTAISDYVLNKNGVVCGVAFDEEMNVVHQITSTKKEVEKFKGSKYVQSDLRNIFLEIKNNLENRKLVLFTGTPCQTAGLRSYLKGTNMDSLILCDIVCHGTPSPLMWREHIKCLENKVKNKIVEYYCRSKVTGWHGHNEMVIYQNGKKDYESILSQKHKVLFHSLNILRPACHNCKYTNLKRPSDITIGDFWGIEKSMPDFDDNKGTSLVLLNSPKGQRLFEGIKENLIWRESNTQDCLQPQLQYPTEPSEKRQQFWEDYSSNGYEYIIAKYAGYNFKSWIKGILRTLLSRLGILETTKRILRKKSKNTVTT